MKKNCVTKRTWDKNAKKFAKESAAAWRDLNKFVESRCMMKEGRELWCELFRNELCEIVDRYVELNCAIYTWCHKNGVDVSDFMCDVDNFGLESLI